MGDPTGFDSAFLVEGKLFPQKEIFRGQYRKWTPTEPKEMDDIAQQRQQRASEMPHMVKQVHTSCHSQGVPLQQGCDP